MNHGFLNFAGVIDAGKAAIVQTAAAPRKALT